MENNSNQFLILGKSNASVAIINEILYENFHTNLNITIIKNMADCSDLDYKIDGININEFFETDCTNFEVSTQSQFIIGAFRAAAKAAIYNYFFKKYNISPLTHTFPTLISPHSFVASTAKIGAGSVVSHQCVIDAYSCLGNFITLNRSCSIGHHTFIDDFTCLNPNTHIAGNCKIGKKVQIGMSSTIIDGITIGENSIIGANSFVNKNVPPNVLVYGSPAKIIKQLE